jgi:hypothetical protein
MYGLFEAFIKGALANLRRIAAATRNEKTIEDLQQDAFLIACEIGEKRGREIDFLDEVDQSLVLRYLNHRSVKRGDWKFRRAERIDATQVDDDGELVNWSRELVAPETSDPLLQIEASQSQSQLERMLSSSYSQATAYVVTFLHFGGDRSSVASYLAVTIDALNSRLRRAEAVVKIQPSLFDLIERIPASFMPQKGTTYLARLEDSRSGEQWGWDFAL